MIRSPVGHLEVKNGLFEQHQAAKVVNIKTLKVWCLAKLPSSSRLRMLILSESETMSLDDFLAKSGTWELLLKDETRD